MLQTNLAENNKTGILRFFGGGILPCMRNYGKILYGRTGHRWQYGCALHAAYLNPQTQTQNTWYYCFSTATMVARKHVNITQ